MTTDKDAMALAAIERAVLYLEPNELIVGPHMATSAAIELREARAHLAERLYLMGGEVARLKQVADSLSEQMVRMEDCITHERDRATRAEAELAAVRAYRDAVMNGVEVYEALDKRATVRTSPENVSDVLDAVARVARAATDAARGGE